MKVVVVAAVAGLAILALGLGAYRLLDDDEERKRAEAAAQQFASYCGRAADAECEVSQLERVAPNQWRFHFGEAGQPSRCLLLDLEEFRATRNDSVYVGGTVEGVSDTPCRPELWLARDAARRLEESAWAKRRRARFVSCAGRGEERHVQYTNRFGCRFSSAGRDGYVLIRTTGRDSFEIESTE